MTAKSAGSKKLLENPFIGNLIVPIAIILVAAVLIFGVSKILSTDRNYKDLVREMHSKTFGNRWVAAYELSKLIATSQIPNEDIPWLVENLVDLYESTQDLRTKKFIVIAMGSLSSQEAINFLSDVLDKGDKEIQFHIVASLGNHPAQEFVIPEQELLNILRDTEDRTLKQATVLALASHMVPAAKAPLVALLTDDYMIIKVSAALGLINYKASEAVPMLKELLLKKDQDWGAEFNPMEVESVKINLLDALIRNKWDALNSEIEILAKDESQIKLTAKAREALNVLKNNGFRNKN